MRIVYKLVIIFGVIYCTASENVTKSSREIQYNMCYSESKHCIQCLHVIEINAILYVHPFDQSEYAIPLMDKLNRIRSQYAKSNGISNMKFTSWNTEFEAMTEQLARYGSPNTKCTHRSDNGLHVVNTNYKTWEFRAELKLEVSEDYNVIVHQQFENATNKLLALPDMMVHNLEEFACCYTYDKQIYQLATIMRCMTYTENRTGTNDLKFGKVCGDCDRTSDRCIKLEWYEGTCVPNKFNEDRLRLFIEPVTNNNDTTTLPISLIFRSSLYVLNAIVLFLIIYVVYATCVICRHNGRYGMTRLSDEMTGEYSLAVVNNVYGHI